MLSMASALEKTKKTRCGVFVEVVTTSTIFRVVSLANRILIGLQYFVADVPETKLFYSAIRSRFNKILDKYKYLCYKNP